jgi:uncharacterized protein (DUF1786 family)
MEADMADILKAKATHRCVTETDEIRWRDVRIAELEKALAQANFSVDQWMMQANQEHEANARLSQQAYDRGIVAASACLMRKADIYPEYSAMLKVCAKALLSMIGEPE